MGRTDPYGEEVEREREKAEAERSARDAMRDAIAKVQQVRQEEHSAAVALADDLFASIVVPQMDGLLADLRKAVPNLADQWESRREEGARDARAYTFLTPPKGNERFKVVVEIVPEMETLDISAYSVPQDSPYAHVMAVSREPKEFHVRGFDREEFSRWLHARLQKCGNIALGVLRPPKASKHSKRGGRKRP